MTLNMIPVSLYANHDKYTALEQGRSHTMRWGANVQERTRSGTMRASYAHSGKDHQLGLGTAGTLALHSGGVTYGPYASDTFALVEAKGASGARINNAQGARIDVFGYGIAPSLAPYRYNTISIDGNSLDQDVELEGGNGVNYQMPARNKASGNNFIHLNGICVQ